MSDDSNLEDGEFMDSFDIPQSKELNRNDILGKDLNFLGFVISKSGNLLVIESKNTSFYSPGNSVLLGDYSTFGQLVDIFGPVSRPLYIVNPLHEKSSHEMVGTPVYICLAFTETIADGEVADSSCDSSSEMDKSDYE